MKYWDNSIRYQNTTKRLFRVTLVPIITVYIQLLVTIKNKFPSHGCTGFQRRTLNRLIEKFDNHP